LMRLSMDAVVLAGRGCQWMRLSSAVFRGAVVNGCGCPQARFSAGTVFRGHGCLRAQCKQVGCIILSQTHCTTPLVFVAVTENIPFATVITHFHFSLASHFSKYSHSLFFSHLHHVATQPPSLLLTALRSLATYFLLPPSQPPSL
jgi:hypothetical protein